MEPVAPQTPDASFLLKKTIIGIITVVHFLLSASNFAMRFWLSVVGYRGA
jgi:hypothetical protein